MASFLIGPLLLGVFTVFLAWFGRVFNRVGSNDVLDFVYRYRIPPTDSACRLVDRYLARTRRYRASWCLVGVALAVSFGIAWYRGLYLGFNEHSPVADIGLMGLSAWFIGLVQAEGYNRRLRYQGPRMASLDTRADDRYRAPRLMIGARAVAAVGTVVSIGCLLAVSKAGRPQVLALALAAIIVIVSVERCQRGIVCRARVVSSPDLLAADEAIRSMAARAVDFGGTGVLLLLSGWQLSRVGIHLYESSYAIAMTLHAISIFLLGAAMLLAWRARRLIRPSARQQAALANAIGAPLLPPPPIRVSD